MKKFLLIWLSWLLVGQLSAQLISQAEYFFNSDPGVGNGLSIPITPGANISQSFSADISNLPGGFHSLYIRTYQNGVWGFFGPRRTFYIDDLSATIPQGDIDPNIEAAEFFFDQDPGPGNGEPISVTPSPNQNISFAADVSNLSGGFHSLYIRTKQGGIWGFFGPRRTFYIDDLGTTIPQGDIDPDIEAAEFFFDQDLGPGNGEPISVTPSPNQNISFAADVSSLSGGFHSLYIRTKQGGIWGFFGPRRTFYIDDLGTTIPQGDIDPNIEAAEFFFDQDPGPGNGESITVAPSPNQNISFAADVSSLSGGFHSLYIRTKQGGRWGFFGPRRTFYIDNLTSETFEVAAINRVEIFFDQDPGVGNGQIIDITEGFSIAQTIEANVPDLPYGLHALYLRVINTNNVPSHFIRRNFTICEPGVLSPELTAAIEPNCASQQYSVTLTMPESWAGPAYTLTNDFNGQSNHLSPVQPIPSAHLPVHQYNFCRKPKWRR